MGPKVAALLEEAEDDLLADSAFSADHHAKLRSTNPLERVNREVGRRSDVGPSGSGETTMLNVICGWERPDAGTIVWPTARCDVPPAQRPWSELAILPQGLGLIPELSVEQNVELPLWIAGRLDESGRSTARALLERFGLEPVPTARPGKHPWASSSVPPWHGRWCCGRPCCWLTSPPVIKTLNGLLRWSPPCAGSPTREPAALSRPFVSASRETLA